MELNFSKAVVTGGAGFIGSHITHALVERGCTVTVVDNLSSGHMKNLDAVREKVAFVAADIRDLEKLKQIFDGSEVVFHQAAVVSVTKTVEDPVGSGRVNDMGDAACPGSRTALRDCQGCIG